MNRLAIAFVAIANSALAADWPQWRGPAHDGITDEKLPAGLDSAEIAWTAEVGTGFATVSVVGEHVLTMGNEDDHDTVWCLDARTGKPIWKYRYACALDPRYYEGGPGGTPSIDAATRSVFTLSKKGHAFCLDLADGAVRWGRDLKKDYALELPEWSFAGSPFVTEKLVILNVGSAGWALDKQTGKTVWRSEETRSGYATPVPVGKDRVAIFSAKELAIVDRDSGVASWRHAWESSRNVNAADPIVAGDRLLISSSAGAALLAPPGGDGAEEVEVWKNKDLRCYFNPGVLHRGHVYAIHGTTHGPTELVCLDAGTGETKWAKGGFGSGGLIAADGGEQLIVFDKGQLTVCRATPERFDRLFQMQVLGGRCWTSPVFSNGRIYCRNAEGQLASVRFKNR